MSRRNPRGKKQVFGVKPHENIRKCAQFVSVINCLRVTCDPRKALLLYKTVKIFDKKTRTSQKWKQHLLIV